jgi:hypothetical protein
VTVEEAQAILEANRYSYEDFTDPARIIVDGRYTVLEMRALVVLALDAERRKSEVA